MVEGIVRGGLDLEVLTRPERVSCMTLKTDENWLHT